MNIFQMNRFFGHKLNRPLFLIFYHILFEAIPSHAMNFKKEIELFFSKNKKFDRSLK